MLGLLIFIGVLLFLVLHYLSHIHEHLLGIEHKMGMHEPENYWGGNNE